MTHHARIYFLTSVFIIVLAGLPDLLHSQTTYYRNEIDLGTESVINLDHITTMDGGSILLITTLVSTDCFITLTKLDPSGTLQWHKRFGPGVTRGCKIVQSPDSGYFFTSIDFNTGRDIYTKIDKNGNLIFSRKIFLPSSYTPATTLGGIPMAMNDGSFYVASTVYSSITGTNYYQIVNLTNMGNPVWSKIYTATYGYSYCRGIDTTRYGNVMLYGAGIDSMTMRSTPILLLLDTSGNIIWYKSYKSPGVDFNATAFDLDNNDNVYASGTFNNFSGPPSPTFVMKTDSAGDVIWAFHYDVNMGANPSKVFVLSGNEIVITGVQYFLKIDNLGQLICARKHLQTYMSSFDTLSSSHYAYTGTSWTSSKPLYYTSDNCGNTCSDSAMNYTVIATSIYDSLLTGSLSLTVAPGVHTLQQSNVTISTQTICTLVAVPEYLSPSGISTIYPSPATDKIYIVGSDQIDLIEMFDHTGKLIFQSDPKSDHSIIDISSYATGVYFVRIYCDDRIEVHSVAVINR